MKRRPGWSIKKDWPLSNEIIRISNPIGSDADGHAEVEVKRAVALVLHDAGDANWTSKLAGGDHAQRSVVRLKIKRD